MIKKIILSLIFATSMLSGEEFSAISLDQPFDKYPANETEQSQFFYISGGLNVVMPTVSLGYQKTYGSLASDVSISGSFFPAISVTQFGRSEPTVMPSLQYKQLFFCNSQNYYGLKTAFYLPGSGFSLLDSPSIDFGVVTGRQMKRKNGKDFFEAGFSPFVYSPSPYRKGFTKGEFSMAPIFFISYGIMI
jgi:hypothetical protein